MHATARFARPAVQRAVLRFPRAAARFLGAAQCPASARFPGAVVLLVLALTWAAATPARAQTGTIAGRVSDAVAGAPLAGAQVVVVGAGASQVTGQNGEYRLSGIPVGQHVVEARATGFAASRQTVAVLAGQTVTLDFALHPAATLEQVQAQPVAADQAIAAMQVRMFPGQPFRDFNTESYAHIPENDFRTVAASPLSTFSIDVDRASYANVRRFIQTGERPPIDAVRIEEMVNYFPYEWGKVAGDHPFSVSTEVWEAPWKTEHRLVRIGLHARSVETEHLPPANLVFLLDVSGSMAYPDKLPLLKKAFALLVEQLRPTDRVAIVVYAGAAGLALPSTPGDKRAEILAALEQLEAGGSTAGGAGIQIGRAHV